MKLQNVKFPLLIVVIFATLISCKKEEFSGGGTFENETELVFETSTHLNTNVFTIQGIASGFDNFLSNQGHDVDEMKITGVRVNRLELILEDGAPVNDFFFLSDLDVSIDNSGTSFPIEVAHLDAGLDDRAFNTMTLNTNAQDLTNLFNCTDGKYDLTFQADYATNLPADIPVKVVIKFSVDYENK